MTILIVVEHDGKTPRDNFRNVLCAARQLNELSGAHIEALVLGAPDAAKAVADVVARAPGLTAVRCISNAAFANQVAENCAPILAEQAQNGVSHVLMAAGALSRMWMPRAAALLDSQMLSEVIAIESTDTFVRPIYAGNALTTVQSMDAIKLLSVRLTAFDAVVGDADSACSD